MKVCIEKVNLYFYVIVFVCIEVASLQILTFMLSFFIHFRFLLFKRIVFPKTRPICKKEDKDGNEKSNNNNNYK